MKGLSPSAAVHEAAAKCLLTTCTAHSVRHVILLSASGAGSAPHPYWASKASAEEHLAEPLYSNARRAADEASTADQPAEH